MTSSLLGTDASAELVRAGRDARHCPEPTLLYQLVEQHYRALVAHLAARARRLPAPVAQEFEDYLKSILPGRAVTPRRAVQCDHGVRIPGRMDRSLSPTPWHRSVGLHRGARGAGR